MKKISILSALVLMTTSAFAETATEKETQSLTQLPAGLQLGAGLSATGGLDGFVGYANKNFDSFWLKRFGLRLDFATTQPIKSFVNSQLNSAIDHKGIEIGDSVTLNHFDVRAKHMAAILDFYPFGNTWFLGGLRVSGGYYTGDLKTTANLTGKLDGIPDSAFGFELAGTKYKYAGNTVNGTARADWNYRGPYVGTGFDLGMFAGIKIYMDAGVVFTNKAAQLELDIPTDNLQQYNTVTNAWETVNVAELEQAKADALSDAQSKLNDIKYYPIIKMGFMYRF